MKMIQATLQKDVYKEFHVHAYHPDVKKVYSNYTNRSSKLSNIKDSKGVVFLGLQYFIKEYLIKTWNETFFKVSKDVAMKNHKELLSNMLGHDVNVDYLSNLYDLGYLPLKIKALPEGTLVPYQVPCFTIVNTVEGFQWLTNMVETVLSSYIWAISTSATTAKAYYDKFMEYSQKTCDNDDHVKFQGHDFSFRGMFGLEAAAMSGFAHLCSGFVGTDTIPAVRFAEDYYNADSSKELIGCSVNATEHSVTCSWQNEGEIEFFKYLMNEVSPVGVLSIVSDTWDFWKVVNEFLPQLKKDIMARDGKVVIRPDSGDPVDIICGKSPLREMPEDKGLIECLWDIFGGTINSKGYKVLNDKIGAIYGDSITLERQEQILDKLERKGFASSNIVLGIGSYTYQYVTRDTHGTAVKATAVYKNNKWEAIYKDPKTDNGKKSLKGLLKVYRSGDNIKVNDNCTVKEESEGLLEVVYENGKLVQETSLRQIRDIADEI